MKGLTFYVCFGGWGGFRIEALKPRVPFRLVLGYMSIAIMRFDLEAFIEKSINTIEDQNSELKELRTKERSNERT